MSKLPLLLVLLLAGCAGPSLPPLTAAHPASPDGLEAPVRLPSQTLALPDDAAPAVPEHHGH